MAVTASNIPDLPIRIDLPVDVSVPPDLQHLPARPGIFAIETLDGGTLGLSVTANLRRSLRVKLDVTNTPSRRVNYRQCASRIRAVEVGSRFEADWAYLQLARQRFPATYRGLLDRWQCWFIECDRGARFPRWSKNAHPFLRSTVASAGPFPDKHAAGRYIDMLLDAFDLCRHHHILLQAPHATACAYKEMGRCAAPCDGSQPLADYHALMQRSIDFTCTPIEQWRGEQEREMLAASARMNFEEAQRKRLLLERTSLALRAEFAHVDRLERFSFVAVMPSTRKQWFRLFAIRGGWIAPVMDIPAETPARDLEQIAATLQTLLSPMPDDFDDAGIENMGMVCWHLYQPRNRKKTPGEFIRAASFDAPALAAALRLSHSPVHEDEATAQLVEHEFESGESPGG